MLQDKQLMFAEDLDLFTPAAGDIVSTNVLDLTTDLNDYFSGEAVRLVTQVTSTFVGGTSLVVKIVTDDNTSLTSPAIISQSGTLPTAVLVAGKRCPPLAIPWGMIATGERYLGVVYTTTGDFTAGTISSWIGWDEQSSYSAWRATSGF